MKCHRPWRYRRDTGNFGDSSITFCLASQRTVHVRIDGWRSTTAAKVAEVPLVRCRPCPRPRCQNELCHNVLQPEFVRKVVENKFHSKALASEDHSQALCIAVGLPLYVLTGIGNMKAYLPCPPLLLGQSRPAVERRRRPAREFVCTRRAE
jgi:hypothetical protein